MTGETIYLRGNHPWLNFADYSIRLGEQFYFTGEHLFQALKSRKLSEHEYVRKTIDPSEAKRRGREVELRKDWEEIKGALMVAVLLLKFCQHRKLRKELIESHPKGIVEARKDPIWGQGPDGNGLNMMGNSLVMVRAILIASKEMMDGNL